MDLSKLSMSELQALQKQLETQLKSNPAKEMAIAEAMKAKPMEPPARMIKRLQEAVAKIPRSESAPGTGKSRAAIIGGDKFPLSPENTKALGRAVEDDVIAKAIEASKERSARGLEKNLVSSTAGKAGSMLRGLGRVAGPLGAAITALDLAQGLGEVQEKGAAKIAEDYKKEEDKKAKMVNFIEESPNAKDYKKSKMAESEAQILTPEVDEFRESLKSRRTELEILRAELERRRQKEERDREREQRGIERQARVRDTLEKTGLLP